MRKFVSGLLLIVFLISPFKIAYGYTNNVSSMEAGKTIRDKYSVKNSIDITGFVPYVFSLPDTDFQKLLNDKILSECGIEALSAQASKYTKSIHFMFQSYPNNEEGIVSIVIKVTTTSSTTKNKNIAITYNERTGKFLYIKDIIGVNGLRIVNSVITNSIANEPDKYNIDSSTLRPVSEDQSFYVNGNTMYVFYENKQFPIQMNKIQQYEIDNTKYYSKQTYDLKMVELRDVVSKFGYTITWNEKTKSIDIKKGTFTTSLALNKNNYVTDGNSKVLESPPALINGTTYVPISFFEQVLNIFYTANGSKIVFSAYSE